MNKERGMCYLSSAILRDKRQEMWNSVGAGNESKLSRREGRAQGHLRISHLGPYNGWRVPDYPGGQLWGSKRSRNRSRYVRFFLKQYPRPLREAGGRLWEQGGCRTRRLFANCVRGRGEAARCQLDISAGNARREVLGDFLCSLPELCCDPH